MLSGLSSYLFGAPSEEEHPAAATQSAAALAEAAVADRLKVVPAAEDEDWTIVDKSSRGGSPLRVEDNPMENLLIEHPSMSVYQQRARPNSRGSDSEESEAAEEEGETSMDAQQSSVATRQQQHRVHHRANSLSSAANAAIKRRKMAQTSQKRREQRHNSRNNIERHNKVQRFNAMPKASRRKQHMTHHHSGRNNDRKCQF